MPERGCLPAWPLATGHWTGSWPGHRAVLAGGAGMRIGHPASSASGSSPSSDAARLAHGLNHTEPSPAKLRKPRPSQEWPVSYVKQAAMT